MNQDIQTPTKELLPVSSNRKAKSINALSNRQNLQQQKRSKRILSSIIAPVSEDDVVSNLSEESIEKISSISQSIDVDQITVEISKTNLNSDHTLVSEESIELATVSESSVFEEDQSRESIEDYIMSLNQFMSPTSATTTNSIEMTPESSISTVDPSAVFIGSVTHDDATTNEISSFEIDSLVKHLRESKFQVLHSTDIDPRYKKLLDACINMVIEDCYTSHEFQLFSRKPKIVLLVSFVMGIFAVSSGFFLFSNARRSYHGPPPT